MDDSSGKTANGRELFGARDGAVRFDAQGNVLTNGDHMTHFIIGASPHRKLAYQPVLYFAVCGRSLLFYSLNFTCLEDLRDFPFENLSLLPRQNLKDVFSNYQATCNAQLSQLAITIPGNNPIVPIDCVKRERQAVYYCFDEATLRFRFGSALVNLFRQTR